MFGTRLKELREERGLSQHELARRSGIKVQNINRWELGRRIKLPLDKIPMLAQGLDLSGAELYVELTKRPIGKQEKAA